MISASSIPIDASEAAQAPNQFDFDLWIEEHHLSDIKNILVERDLCDLQTLTLQSNSFSNLIDSVHSTKPSLVPAVCKALHSLKRQSSSSLSHQQSRSLSQSKPTLKL